MFSDQQITQMVGPQLVPGERILSRARGVEKPWYSRLFSRLGSLFWRNYLLVATDRRLFLIHHAGLLGGKKVKTMDTLAWAELDQVHLGWGIFNKNITVKSQSRGYSKTVSLGRFWMKDNFGGAEQMVQTWGQARTLPSGAPMAALPQAAYGR